MTVRDKTNKIYQIDAPTLLWIFKRLTILSNNNNSY